MFVRRQALAAIVEEWIADHEAQHDPNGWTGASGAAGALDTLALQTGIVPRQLWGIRHGRQTSGPRSKNPVRYVNDRVTLDLADRLLTGIGHPEYWHTRLAEATFEDDPHRRLAA